MKGNEKDCICAKINGKHTRRCDAYRLSEFEKKAASMTTPIEKKSLHIYTDDDMFHAKQEAYLRGKEEGLREALSELKKLKVRRFTYWRPWGMGVDDAISKVKSLLTSTQP